MIISVNWLKKLTDIDLPIDELATLIGARLVEIEEVKTLGGKYKDVIIARVAECNPLEGSDHLNVTKLDDGGSAKDVERDENGLVQVVCGAPNVRAGLLVAWLPPKATVPETYDDKEPFVLDARKLRGVMSNGMIASAKELDLYDSHEGILEIGGDIAVGTTFVDGFGLDDYLLDIENKSLTHRPDTFGVIGFAREVAGIQDRAFETPEWLANVSPDYGQKQGDVATPTVTIDDPILSDRYQAVVLSNVDATASSPLDVQSYLARVGIRPINAVVDVTNYLMILTGQPLHAFDYDKLVAVGGTDIHVRSGRKNETLQLLDGREITLSSEDIVIAAGETVVGLAGAMGGASTQIDETTKNVIIESATFNLYNLRATQMRHGIFSEAITRFTKGQPAELSAPVLDEAIRLLGRYAGAVRVSDVAEHYPGKRTIEPIRLAANKVNDVLGTSMTATDMQRTLTNVEFDVVVETTDVGEVLVVKYPYWRADIHIDEDIIEEIGRLNGFDSIIPTLAMRDFTAVRPTSFDALRADIRAILVRAGANEVLTYSFVHGDVLKKAGQDPADSYRIINSLSPDLQYYRQSITPSILGLVHGNSKAGYDQFALFELNKTHTKKAELVDGVPAEMHRIGLTLARKKTDKVGAPYYAAKQYVEYLGAALGLRLAYKPFTGDSTLAFARPFELKRSARIVDTASNQSIGIVGEYKKTVAREFKLPDYAAGFELLTEGIELALQHKKNTYAPISRYPSAERDICFQVDALLAYGQVVEPLETALSRVELETSVAPIDIYQAGDGDVKNITIRIRFTSHDHTLSGEEIAAHVNEATAAVIDATGARVI